MGVMDWKEYYRSRLKTPDQAVEMIKSNDKVVDGFGTGRADIFQDPLLNRKNDLENVTIICGYHTGKADYCNPEYEGHFRAHAVFISKPVRQAYIEGRADYVPVPFSQYERYIESLEPDVAFIQVTPPDKHGFVSLGVDVDYTRAMVDCAKTVIAHVNNQMPWLNGDAVVPVSKIDYFVEQDRPLMEIHSVETFNDVDLAIANNVASLVEDGNTMQIGVGAIPDQVLKLLKNRKHLGIHTEFGTPSILSLMQSGAIDNSRKTLDPEYTVCTFIGGTREFYDYLDHNPTFLMRRSSYVTNPFIVAQQENMFCVNSAVQVDLYGQVVSEMIGSQQYSGVGGQLDFMRGAAAAKNGRSVICFPSTAAKGTVSRIVPFVNPESAITDSRNDVMYIATEYGVVNLWGKTVEQRAKALISIAHPDFREKLEKEFFSRIRRKKTKEVSKIDW